MTDSEQLAAVRQTARRFARREVAPLVGTKGRDGDLGALPRLLERAQEVGLLAAAGPDSPGRDCGVWGRACLEEGDQPSLAVLEQLAAACAGVAACVHVSGLAALECRDTESADLSPSGVALLQQGWRPTWGALDAPPAGAATLQDGRLSGGASFVLSPLGCASYVIYAADRKRWVRVLVARGTAGLRVDCVGQRTGIAALEVVHLTFDDVAVPAAQQLGPAPPAAHLRRSMLGLAAIAVGNAQGAIDAAARYTSERYQGGDQIEAHPAVQLLLGDSRARVAAARACLTGAARAAGTANSDARAVDRARSQAADHAGMRPGGLRLPAAARGLRLHGGLPAGEAAAGRDDPQGHGHRAEYLAPALRQAAERGGRLMDSRHLSPERASKLLGPLGQLLYETDPAPIWDHDTQTLPRPLRRLRALYRDFASQQLAPLALRADLSPAAIDLRELFLRAARRGLQTEFMPPPFGTMSVPAVLHALLLPSALKAEELCAADGGLGVGLLAHDLGIAPLFIAGDLPAYVRWLGRIYREIRAGEPAIAAFAITEPGAGSDVEETEGAARARLCCFFEHAPGGFRLNGRKCFISDGAVARWITLFAAERGRGIESWTCFLLDSAMEGLSVGRSERKMGQRAADASELILEDVFVPRERVIGAVGAGWAINRNVLNYSRPVVGAIALGIARGAFEHTVRFCNRERLGGRPLSSYQHVQLTLADMLAKLSAMRAMIWQATRYRLPFQAAGAATKVFCSDAAWEVCNQAFTLLGDHGVTHANSVEKAARDARLTQIYEGTNQINRLAIFEGQARADFGAR